MAGEISAAADADAAPGRERPGRIATAWPELAPLPRLVRIGAAWAALIAGSPGVLAPGGHVLGAVVFAALWSLAAIRPGRRAWLVEWGVAAAAFGVLMHWLGYISWAVVPPTGIGMGAYAMAAGTAARYAARWLPGALAAALGWASLETLRDLIEPPFGMGWLRLGHLTVDFAPVAGMARLWGVAGISFLLVLFVASVTVGRSAFVRSPRGRRAELACLLLAGLLGVLAESVPAPATEPGPTLLLVQPNIAQDRKLTGASDMEIVSSQAALTAGALRDGPVDLVCWSETMLRAMVVGEGALEAAEAGTRFDPWLGLDIDPLLEFAYLEEGEVRLVQRDLLGRVGTRALLPPGTAFLAGTEEWRALDGRLRRFNAGVLWRADGERRSVSKRHLVPLGETMYGLERYAWGRGVVGGYIADLAHVRDEPALVFEDRDGRTWRVGVPICFDNAFLDAFRDDVDFHVVLSNEAWYRDSIELDQMVAFTRMAAIASGRAVARCTNSGVSMACDAEGRELGRVTVDGGDREVPGVLRVSIPVPSDRGARTPFGRFGVALRWGLVAAGLAAAAIGWRRGAGGGGGGPRARGPGGNQVATAG